MNKEITMTKRILFAVLCSFMALCGLAVAAHVIVGVAPLGAALGFSSFGWLAIVVLTCAFGALLGYAGTPDD